MTWLVAWSPTRGAASHVLSSRAHTGRGSGPRATNVERVLESSDGFLAYVSGFAERPLFQTAMDVSSGVGLVGEIRLDNRTELKRDLNLRNSEPCTDASLALSAYLRWGQACLNRLLGDFAFAIHEPGLRRLFVARDPFGIKPLYYSTVRETFLFSTKLAELAAVPEASSKVDETAVVEFLGAFPPSEARTMFARIGRLPPGNGLLVCGHRPAIQHRYYDLSTVRELRLSSDREYSEALREELRRAVASRLPAAGLNGVLLSGGLDSSMLTALGAECERARGHRIWTLSAKFEATPASDESAFRDLVCASAHSERRELEPDPFGSAGDLERCLDVFGQPALIGGHWLTWPLAELARREGVGILLTGVDGDRVVSHGTGRFAELARASAWHALYDECRHLPNITVSRKARTFAVNALLAMLPPSLLARVDRLDPRRFTQYAGVLRHLRLNRLLASGAAGRLTAFRPRAVNTREAHLELLEAPDRAADLELLHALGCEFGVEFRHPFFDRRVVELCLSFPGSQKRNHGVSRPVLRGAMSGLVPDLVRQRATKTSLTPAFVSWVHGLLRREYKYIDFNLLRSYVDVAAAQSLVAEFENAPVGQHVDFVLRCVILCKWLAKRAI